jgi:hypothetical protein
VALANGINANQLRRWMRERGIEPPELSCLPLRVAASEPMGGFVPVQLSQALMRPSAWNCARAPRGHGGLARVLGRRLWRLAARVARVIRVEALWLSVAPLDMRAGMDTLLAQVVRVFGEARPHHAYLFANRRGTRMKVLIHDGQGIWLACRRLNQGRFRWAEGNGSLTLSQAQFDALVLGLPWQQLGGDGVIRMI